MDFASQFCLIVVVVNCLGLATGQHGCPCSAYDKVENRCELEVMSAGGGTCTDEQVEFLFERNYQYGGSPSNWPYLISLQLPVLNRQVGCYQHFCSGVLMSDNVVLTAAHCMDAIIQPEEGELQVQLQAVRAPPCRNLRGESANVIYVVKHPDWIRKRGVNDTFNADLALLKIDTKLEGPYVDIGVYTDEEFEVIVEERIQFVSAGYNKFSYDEPAYYVQPLYENEVSVIGLMLCEFFTKSYGSSTSVAVYNNETQICGYSPLSYGCQLDSGTPLIRRNASGNDQLVGMAAYGERIRCANDDMHQAPVFYTKIGAYAEWIKKAMKKLKRRQSDYQINAVQQGYRNETAEVFWPIVPNPDQ